MPIDPSAGNVYIPPTQWQDPWEEIPDYNTGGNAPAPSPEPEPEKEYATYADWFEAQTPTAQTLVQAQSDEIAKAEKAKTDKAYAEKLAAEKKTKKAKTVQQMQAEQLASFGFVAPNTLAPEPQANQSRSIPESTFAVPTLMGRMDPEVEKAEDWMGLLHALLEQREQRSLA